MCCVAAMTRQQFPLQQGPLPGQFTLVSARHQHPEPKHLRVLGFQVHLWVLSGLWAGPRAALGPAKVVR
jgi:hypothetical protein